MALERASRALRLVSWQHPCGRIPVLHNPVPTRPRGCMLQDLRGQGRQIDDADATQQGWITSVWLAVVVACVYILLAKLSLALLTPEGVAVFWPAAGFAAGILIAFGPSARWAVAIGTMVATILANLLGDRNIPSSVVFALCNAGEALLAAGLDRALLRLTFQPPLASQRLGVSRGCDYRRGRFRDRRGDWICPVPRRGGIDLRHLAELVCVRRTRHRDRRPAGDRACLGRTTPATAKRNHRGCRRAGIARRHQCHRHRAATDVLGDSRTRCIAVSGAAVDRGTLPAGLCGSRDLHRYPCDRLDDNDRIWPLRRPCSADG